MAAAPTSVQDIVTEPAGDLGPSVEVPPEPKVPVTFDLEVCPAPTEIAVSVVATESTAQAASLTVVILTVASAAPTFVAESPILASIGAF